MTASLFIVFDLDGTLALIDHRQHFVRGGGKDWRSFFEACDLDQPCSPLVRLAQDLAASGRRVEIWSGRSDQVRTKTEAWLQKHGLSHLPLKMRRAKDFRADTILKAEWLRRERRKPDLIFDDRSSVVAMWRQNGVICAQVAPGDF